MKPIAHRGLWTTQENQNSLESILAAARNGYGIETDVRDQNGTLVISHDPPIGNNLTLQKMLESLKDTNVEILLNIKSDGLQSMAMTTLEDLNLDIKFFDMSVPETIKYAANKLPYLIRVSELETFQAHPKTYDGLWIDDFSGFWLNYEKMAEIAKHDQVLYVVSAELHGNDHKKQWTLLKKHWGKSDFRLCTDFPREAVEFFHD